MAPPLIQLKEIRLTFGGAPLLADVELNVSANERVCLIGRNGSGKSTLLKIAAGLVEPDGGSRFVQPGATIRYLPQEPNLAGYATTHDYVEAGLQPGDDPNRAYYLLGHLGLTGQEAPPRAAPRCGSCPRRSSRRPRTRARSGARAGDRRARRARTPCAGTPASAGSRDRGRCPSRGGAPSRRRRGRPRRWARGRRDRR